MALRTIFNLSNRTNVDDKRILLSINKPDIDRKIELLCHSYIISLDEKYCDNRNIATRSHVEGRRQLKISRPINNKVSKSYHYKLRKWWNDLPTKFHQIRNVREFKRALENDCELLETLD